MTEAKNDTKLKAYFKCSQENKKKIPESKIVLPISVGQKYHEDEKFAATVELLNHSNLKHVTIMICDSLQRHTLQLTHNYNKEDAYKISFEEGTKWIERNQHIYEKLTMPYDIQRWDYWLNSSQYIKQQKLTKKLYKENKLFRDIIDNDVIAFLKRYSNRTKIDVLCSKNFQHCFAYVNEEGSIVPLWVGQGSNFVIYPGERTKSMCAAYEVFVNPGFPDLIKWLKMDFKKYKL